MSRINLDNLREDYHKDLVVPFIGAGLSAPFNVPTWGMLINYLTEKYKADANFLPMVVKHDLDLKDYWGAIESIKKFAKIKDPSIQQEIVGLIKKKQVKLEDENSHNYADLGKMNFKLHLTTNYENLLHKYIDCDTPILLKNIQFNAQWLFEEKRICHLHGYTSDPGTIVISKESYEELYKDNKYENLLKLVTGSKKILFMGFSFDDQFVMKLIQDHKELFKTTHYILLHNPPEEKIMSLLTDYGLNVIPYYTEEGTHSEEIRKILNYIDTPINNDTNNINDLNSKKLVKETSKPIVIGAGLSEMNKNVESNLFYKKLELENIDSLTIRLSTIFYIKAEEYVRILRNNGMTSKILDAMLAKVFVKYLERYQDTFKKYGDSQEFLKVVHQSLAEIDFGRHTTFLENNSSDAEENRGMIHVLAEEEENEVWWGEKRCNG